MLIIYRHITDPFLNIAAEEYFVKHATEDICMVWTNEPSVIIGKHQNVYAEINYPYVHRNKIPVIRRISGGGTVYHDQGNVNFSFIQKISAPGMTDFKHFTDVIKQFIQSYGLEVTTNTRNSLFVGNQKFSGHAEHIFRDKVLHHGTLLFNTNLETLRNCLRSNKEFQSKAMPSVKSDVGNLAPLLPQSINTHQFIEQFINWLAQNNPKNISYNLRPNDTDAIFELAETKYKTWKWNYGYSPVYSFKIDIPVKTKKCSSTIKVEQGKISSVENNELDVNHPCNSLFKNLIGLEHKEETIQNFLIKSRDELEHAGINAVSIYNAFF